MYNTIKIDKKKNLNEFYHTYYTCINNIKKYFNNNQYSMNNWLMGYIYKLMENYLGTL